jgi:hypothetical protein
MLPWAFFQYEETGIATVLVPAAASSIMTLLPRVAMVIGPGQRITTSFDQEAIKALGE